MKKIRNRIANIPFTIVNIVIKNLNSGVNILDIPCGDGSPFKKILQSHAYKSTVGCDIFLQDLNKAKYNKIHGDLVLCDVRKLPFKNKSFDIVLCMELIEHFEKDEGFTIINELEKVARNKIILTTPVGFLPQEIGGDGNIFQLHKSGFSPFEFKNLGYKVRGFGISKTYSITKYIPNFYIQKLIRRFLRIIFTPFSYFLPNIGERMVCIKRLD